MDGARSFPVSCVISMLHAKDKKSTVNMAQVFHRVSYKSGTPK